MTLSCSLVKSTIVAALGGLLFGFDTAVIAGTTKALTREYDLSPGSLGFTVASALVGTIVGALLASYPGDRLGRRDSLRIMACCTSSPRSDVRSPGTGRRSCCSGSSVALESAARPCAAFRARAPVADLPRLLDRDVQPARGHQRDPVLLERHLCACWLHEGVGGPSGCRDRLHEPRLHDARDVDHRPRGAADAHAHRVGGDGALPRRRRADLLPWVV